MIKLIQNIDIYAPEHLGKKDVLIILDKIVKIAENIIMFNNETLLFSQDVELSNIIV